MLFGSSSEDTAVASHHEPANAGGRIEPYDYSWRDQRMGEHQNGVADNWWWYKNAQKMLEETKRGRND